MSEDVGWSLGNHDKESLWAHFGAVSHLKPLNTMLTCVLLPVLQLAGKWQAQLELLHLISSLTQTCSLTKTAHLRLPRHFHVHAKASQR